MTNRAHRRSAAPSPPIVTLTLNPTVDLTAIVDKVEPERKLRCRDLTCDPGGGGVNVARVIHRLAGDVLAIVTAGGETGVRLQTLLNQERVRTLVIPIGAETREDFTAFETATGRQYRFVFPGPELSAGEWRQAARRVSEIHPRPDVLVISGSLPPGAPTDLYARLAIGARKAGARVALDATGAAFDAAVRAGVWLIKPNLRELEALHGAPLADETARIAACRGVIARGGAQIVALSLGHEGALLVTADEAWRAPPMAITPVSTVGAGDSFLAGLVLAFTRGRPPREALAWASATASATLLAPGTRLCSGADVTRLLTMVRVEAVVSTADTAGSV